MLAVNYSEARKNLKDVCDKVTDDFETIIVTRKGNKNVVIISEAEYNNMLENAFIRKNKGYYDELMKSKEQLENGFCKKRELIEVEDE